MKKYLNWALMLPLIASLALAGCQKDDEVIKPYVPPPGPDNPVEDMVLIGSATSDLAEVDIRVYADMDLYVGHNVLYVAVTEKGTFKPVTNADVMFKPMMEMTSMSHACPVENPTGVNADKLFEGAVIFIMPSGMMGSWTLGVHVMNKDNQMEDKVDMDISVTEPADAKLFSFESPVDGKKIFITLIEPSKPEVGMNDLIISAHQKAGMMDFPAITDLNIEFEPLMPSMGHGSPNNVNPVHTEMGHYKGVVNFTMSGWWELNMTIKDDQDAILDDKHAFDINF